MSGGLWGLTNEWVLRVMKETPKEMEAKAGYFIEVHKKFTKIVSTHT